MDENSLDKLRISNLKRVLVFENERLVVTKFIKVFLCISYFIFSIQIAESVIINLRSFNGVYLTYKVKKFVFTGLIIFTSAIGLDLLLPYNFEALLYIGWIFSNSYLYLL